MHRQIQPVARDRVHKPRGISGQQQACDAGGPDIDRQRAKHRDRRHALGVSKPLPQLGIAVEIVPDESQRIIRAIAPLGHHAHVDPPIRQRRDTAVPPRPNMHFANRTWSHLFAPRRTCSHLAAPVRTDEVGPERPPSRSCGMGPEADGPRHRRAASIGSDRDGGRHARHRAGGVAKDQTAHDYFTGSFFGECTLHRQAGLEPGAGCDRLLEEPGVQHAARDRQPHPSTAVAGFNRGIRPGHAHPGERQSRIERAAGKAERGQQADGAGIQRVAAQFVARERLPIDEQHARAGARELPRGDGARRSGSRNQHVEHVSRRVPGRARCSSIQSRGSCRAPPRCGPGGRRWRESRFP